MAYPPLNPSGPISLGGSVSGQSVNLAVGQAANASISFNSSVTRLLTGTTAGTQLSMPSQFWGKSFTPATSTFIYDAGNLWAIYVRVVATYNSTGDYFLAGAATNTSTSATYAYVAKFNSAGVLQWQKTYTDGGTSTLFIAGTANNLYATVDQSTGHLYAIGYVSGGNGLIAKIDGSTGAVLWCCQVTAAPTEQTAPICVTVDSAGNALVLFQRANTSTPMQAGYLMKFNSSGSLLWRKQTNDYGLWAYHANITTDSSNNIYISSSVRDPATTYRGINMTKLDSSGFFLWCKNLTQTTRVGGMDADAATSAISSAGRLYVSGYLYGGSSGVDQYLFTACIAELDTSTGATVNTYCFRPSAMTGTTNTIYNMVTSPAGDVYCTFSHPNNSDWGYGIARFPANLSAPTWAGAWEGYYSPSTGLRGFLVTGLGYIGNSYILVGDGNLGAPYKYGAVAFQMPNDGSNTGNKVFSTLNSYGYDSFSSSSLAALTPGITNVNLTPTIYVGTNGVSAVSFSTIALPGTLTTEVRAQ